ncbi:hypothetical protein MtrunA17_Chr6g0464731 [Medicago truncatula]|uniref:Uncharacterized protein n=1 Tax=Medicago truncatula TaxID=3880 RepID=A0A396HER4_MEDTR|nr:hypothetical protein MtrunA17_Chr6g0464731 [Medicago truncatula]
MELEVRTQTNNAENENSSDQNLDVTAPVRVAHVHHQEIPISKNV